jgi:hypothetical protein
MKKLLFFILVLAIATNLSARKTVVLPDVQKPHQIVVDGSELYIFDEAEYSLHIYTISPFALKAKIGQKGDGPHDFKYLPFVYVQPEALACTDFTKTVWFSKKGEVLKVKNYTEFSDFDLNSEMLLFPVKEFFLRITADHGWDKRHVYLLDSGFKTIKELYEGPFFWQTGLPVLYRTDTIAYKDLILIADTQKGIYFEVFDVKGYHIRTIDKSQDVEQIPDRPLLHQYCVSEDKIYAVTYKIEDDKTEMIVLDLEGTILQRHYLPLASIRPKRGVLRYDLFVVDQDKLYELIQNSETGKWELLITNLNQENSPGLMGPYFGQKPPGKTPEIFAPGIVSTEEFREFSGTFTPDGKEYYFFRFADDAGMMMSQLLEEGWTAPKPAPFNTKHIDNEPHITPDGQFMFFNSNRPFPGSDSERRPTQIWFMERLDDSWSEPQHLCEGMFVTSSRNGNVYLNDGITRLVKGKFAPFQKIAGALNFPLDGWQQGRHSSIVPDESFLIFDTQPVGSEWNADENLFVCFRLEDGSWSESFDLGGKLNLPGGKMLATFSPDSKYLFFCNRGDIYWVDARIIEELKPAKLN